MPKDFDPKLAARVAGVHVRDYIAPANREAVGSDPTLLFGAVERISGMNERLQTHALQHELVPALHTSFVRVREAASDGHEWPAIEGVKLKKRKGIAGDVYTVARSNPDGSKETISFHGIGETEKLDKVEVTRVSREGLVEGGFTVTVWPKGEITPTEELAS